MPQTVLPWDEPDPRVSDRADEAQYSVRLKAFVYRRTELIRDSQIEALDSEFATLAKQLEGLSNLAEGWDGYNAPKPSRHAIDEAKEILQGMQQELVRPYWISASADGGVAFSFASPGIQRAQIEILNNGEKFAHLYDLDGNSHTEDWTETPEGKTLRDRLEPILQHIRP
jgi:hypothetical protein